MKKLILSLLVSAFAFSSQAAVPEKIYVLGSNCEANGQKTGWDPWTAASIDVVDGAATVVIKCLKAVSLNIYTASPEELREAEKIDYLWGKIGETEINPNSLESDMFGVEQGVNNSGYLKLTCGGTWTLKYTQNLTRVTVDCKVDNDVANFQRYNADNNRIMAEPNDGTRVVYMGNSITDNWPSFRSSFFTDNNFIGRGISGQTSYEMLLRFREDVVKLKPAVVVISAGTNDIAGNFCSYVEGRTIGNIESMAEIAQANGIKVLLASVLPVTAYGWAPHVTDHKDKIEALNKLIKDYAAEKGFTYVDYYSKMVASDRSIIASYSEDGVHPNNAGYEVMEGVVLPLIRKALDASGAVKEIAAESKAELKLVDVDGNTVTALQPLKVYDCSGKLVAVLTREGSAMLSTGVYVASAENGASRFSVN